MEEYSPDFTETLRIVGGTTVWGAAVKIFLATADEDLPALCQVNQFFAEVCRNNDAWKAKFRQKYGDLLDGVDLYIDEDQFDLSALSGQNISADDDISYRSLYIHGIFGIIGVLADVIDIRINKLTFISMEDTSVSVFLPVDTTDKQADEIKRLIVSNGLTVEGDQEFMDEDRNLRVISYYYDDGQQEQVNRANIAIVRYLKYRG